ncbi:importin-5-like [Lineus longissimus]|uniref:importin-5-like n=1 Tax=Lineus longissimus TaxID=88925 RepID=UPI002B4DCA17
MADEAQAFEGILTALSSPDNTIRSRAEEEYEAIPLIQKIELLRASLLRSTQCSLEQRSLAAVLLRRVFTTMSEESWNKIPVPIQKATKEELLQVIQTEPNLSLRKKICDVVAELTRNMLDDDGNQRWPDVLKFLYACNSSQDAGLRECALHIFSSVPGLFGNQQNEYKSVIKEMLYSCLNFSDSASVRFEAVRATTCFLVANEDDVQGMAPFRDLMKQIVDVTAENIKAKDDDSLLKCLVDLAESMPKFLRNCLNDIIELCLQCMTNSELEMSHRHLALEVMVTLSETASAMIRKHPTYTHRLVPEVLAFMVDLDDDEDWATADDVEDEDNESNAITGESALDRLACGLGGKTILPHIISTVPQMLQNPDWRYRHAALMAISACGEGCHKQMQDLLGSIIDTVIPFLMDPHPRVRYACCNALGQMSTDFGPMLQKNFHAKVVPGLIRVMDDPTPRVQAHAGAALVNFSEDCPKAVMAAYLDLIITKLEAILNHKIRELLVQGTKLVLEQVVTTLASVADTAEERFIHHYDRFMPSLKYIVQNATSEDYKLLRGKTIECISLIGLAVGKEKFMPDASEVMQLLLKTQVADVGEDGEMSEDDPQMSYMISAWARMCKIMGQEFEQFLPLVMPSVLKAASIKPEVALVDTEDVKAMENDAEWQFVTLGDQQKFGIRTAGLDEKATACQMLVCYARELKTKFADYTEQVVQLMVPLLKFYFHDVVRIAAAESLPYLIDCARIRGDQYLAEMWAFIAPNLLKAVETEPENDILGEIMHSLAKCIENMGNGCLTAEQLVELMRVLDKIIKEHFQKQAERQEQRKDEDYDEVVEENLMNEDDEDIYTLSKISDVIHALFGTYKEAFLPYFELLIPHFTKLVGHEQPWPDRQWGLCIWDDVLEFAGPHSVKYREFFVPHMQQYICDKQPEVRQAAAYGIGVMAVNGGQEYAQFLAECMQALGNVIQDPEARSPENINPTENAIAAVSKILKHNHGNIDVNEVLPHWLSWLPVWEDADESVHIYNYFCDLVEANHPVLLGENNSNVPRILAIIAEALHREVFPTDEPLYTRIGNIVRQVQTNTGMFTACIQQLSPEQQQALSILVQQQ